MGRVAMAYGRGGWRVFPCCSPIFCAWDDRCPGGRDLGKHPIPKGGLKTATADLAAIRGWWRRYPKANIGLRTGPGSGVWVLDVDSEHGGDASLERLEAVHGTLDTLTAQTGGGGYHLYYTWPEQPIPNSAGRVGEGLDVRGEVDGRAGYVIAPPSLHRSGHRYRWTGDGRTPAAAPAWLIDLATPTPTRTREPIPFTPAKRGYWQKAVAGEVERLHREVRPGIAHKELMSSAYRIGQLVHLGMTDRDVDQAAEDLADAALENAAKPSNRPKAIRDAAQGIDNGKANPRTPGPRA